MIKIECTAEEQQKLIDAISTAPISCRIFDKDKCYIEQQDLSYCPMTAKPCKSCLRDSGIIEWSITE